MDVASRRAVTTQVRPIPCHFSAADVSVPGEIALFAKLRPNTPEIYGEKDDLGLEAASRRALRWPVRTDVARVQNFFGYTGRKRPYPARVIARTLAVTWVSRISVST